MTVTTVQLGNWYYSTGTIAEVVGALKLAGIQRERLIALAYDATLSKWVAVYYK